MDNKLEKILYFLEWPWGIRQGIRVDNELSEDYPALLVQGQGACLVSVAEEIEDVLEDGDDWMSPNMTIEDVDNFLFGGEAPTAYDTAYMMIPQEAGLQLRKKHAVRFDPPAEDREAFYEHISEEDFLRGGVAPFARSCAVYEGDEIVALAGGRLQSGVLDLTCVTREDKRGNGYGLSAVSAMIEAYPKALPLWRVEAENEASIALAKRLGFIEYLKQEGIILLEED